MIKTEDQRDYNAVRGALVMLEQIAKRSTDQNSRVLAEGPAGELRACVEARVLCGNADCSTPVSDAAFLESLSADVTDHCTLSKMSPPEIESFLGRIRDWAEGQRVQLVRELAACPECGSTTHQCEGGDPGCIHCDKCGWMRQPNEH